MFLDPNLLISWGSQWKDFAEEQIKIFKSETLTLGGELPPYRLSCSDLHCRLFLSVHPRPRSQTHRTLVGKDFGKHLAQHFLLAAKMLCLEFLSSCHFKWFEIVFDSVQKFGRPQGQAAWRPGVAGEDCAQASCRRAG